MDSLVGPETPVCYVFITHHGVVVRKRDERDLHLRSFVVLEGRFDRTFVVVKDRFGAVHHERLTVLAASLLVADRLQEASRYTCWDRVLPERPLLATMMEASRLPPSRR